MKPVVIFQAVMVMLLAGCVAGNTKLEQSAAVSLAQIHIVPIEGPPLSGIDLAMIELPPGAVPVAGNDTFGNKYVWEAARWGLLVTSGYIGAVPIILIFDEPVVGEPPWYTDSSSRVQGLESFLDNYEIWEPTAEIAEEAMRQLKTASGYAVTVNEEVRPLPGVERREATYLMENWMAPLRAWYNMDESPFGYDVQSDDGAVLEVGLLNYELTNGLFLIQVVMKLVDPETGSVIANARNASYPKIGNPAPLFADDAEGYKRLFRANIRPLVTQCINDLGLGER
jgi:hypothetical protein